MVGIRVESVNRDVEIAGVVEDPHLRALGCRLADDRLLLREAVNHRRGAPGFIGQYPVDLDRVPGSQRLDLVLLARTAQRWDGAVLGRLCLRVVVLLRLGRGGQGRHKEGEAHEPSQAHRPTQTDRNHRINLAGIGTDRGSETTENVASGLQTRRRGSPLWSLRYRESVWAKRTWPAAAIARSTSSGSRKRSVWSALAAAATFAT